VNRLFAVGLLVIPVAPETRGAKVLPMCPVRNVTYVSGHSAPVVAAT
jgi:hypothetical protein